jgi:DNA-binding transcriptional LysR family regulator
VPGVTVRKWTRAWTERHPEIPLEVSPVAASAAMSGLGTADIDLAFVRLPIDRTGLSVIRLYGEVPVLVVPRDSELAGRDSIPIDEVDTLEGVVDLPRGETKDAVALVAAGVGSLRLPHSLARLHARKDVVALPIDGGSETEIAIAWLSEQTTPHIEEFVGIVRGRTAASSRGGDNQAEASEKAAKPARKSATGPTVKPTAKPHRVTGNRAQARKRKGRR